MKIVTVVLTMALIVFLGSCVENIFHCGCGCDDSGNNGSGSNGSGNNGSGVTPPFETITRTYTIRIESVNE